MKICYINNLFKPYAVGGAEKVVEERAREELKKGNEVFVITSAPWSGCKSLRPEKKDVDEIPVYYFFVPNIFWYKNLSKHNFLFKLAWHKIDLLNCWAERIINSIIKQERPEIVELHNLMGMGMKKIKRSTFVPTFGSEPRSRSSGRGKDQKIKTILYLHDVQLVEPSGVLPWNHVRDNWMQKFYSWIMKKKIGSPEVVISPSDFLMRFYKERGFFKNSDFRLPIVDFAGQNGNSIIKNQKSKIHFLFVGSLVKHKGIEVLMQAWDQFCHFDRSEESAQLHIVGSGILESKVKEWAANHSNVIVHGRKEGRELEEIYKNSDILIFPSICLENCPVAILEAQKYGLKIIASDTGGVKEILANYEKKELILPENENALAKILQSS